MVAINVKKSNSKKLLLLAFCSFLVLIVILKHTPDTDKPLINESSAAETDSGVDSCHPKTVFPPLRTRFDLPALLQQLDLKSGIEVGVKQGVYSEAMLRTWTSCTSYKLVDLWAHQENYEDHANVSNEQHDSYYRETKIRLKRWENKTEYFKMYSTKAAKKIPKESADFIYIDARHDYCGVTEDLESYWPLLKPGGIMSGHDYIENHDAGENQDWGLCEDGTRNDRAVKGAVDDFFFPKGIQILVTFKEANFHTWFVQKPLC